VRDSGNRSQYLRWGPYDSILKMNLQGRLIFQKHDGGLVDWLITDRCYTQWENSILQFLILILCSLVKSKLVQEPEIQPHNDVLIWYL
jgi:hypothetical protein